MFTHLLYLFERQGDRNRLAKISLLPLFFSFPTYLEQSGLGQVNEARSPELNTGIRTKVTQLTESHYFLLLRVHISSKLKFRVELRFELVHFDMGCSSSNQNPNIFHKF